MITFLQGTFLGGQHYPDAFHPALGYNYLTLSAWSKRIMFPWCLPSPQRKGARPISALLAAQTEARGYADRPGTSRLAAARDRRPRRIREGLGCSWRPEKSKGTSVIIIRVTLGIVQPFGCGMSLPYCSVSRLPCVLRVMPYPHSHVDTTSLSWPQ